MEYHIDRICSIIQALHILFDGNNFTRVQNTAKQTLIKFPHPDVWDGMKYLYIEWLIISLCQDAMKCILFILAEYVTLCSFISMPITNDIFFLVVKLNYVSLFISITCVILLEDKVHLANDGLCESRVTIFAMRSKYIDFCHWHEYLWGKGETSKDDCEVEGFMQG